MFTIGEISDNDDDNGVDCDDDFVKGDTREFGRKLFGHIACPYILPFLSNRRRRHLDNR